MIEMSFKNAKFWFYSRKYQNYRSVLSIVSVLIFETKQFWKTRQFEKNIEKFSSIRWSHPKIKTTGLLFTLQNIFKVVSV